MQSIAIFAVLFGAAMATYSGPGASQCSAGNTVACCDTSGGDGILGNVLGGSCDIPNLLSSTTPSQRGLLKELTLTNDNSLQQLHCWQHLLLPGHPGRE